MDTEPLAFGEENEPKRKFKHPYITISHMLFRAMSLVVYILCGFSQSGFISSFIVIVLLISIDFWIVKNITGRLMVGLRWWNYIDENGNSHWVFEARKGDQQGQVSPIEANIFWVVLVATPAIWTILFMIALIKWNLKWIMIVCIALALSGSNLYGYIKCKIDKSGSITGSVRGFAASLAQKEMLSNITSYFTRSPPTTSNSSTV